MRKRRKWKHIKCSIKPKKGNKEWRTKIGTKNKGNIQKTNEQNHMHTMKRIDINPTIPMNTLNVNGLMYQERKRIYVCLQLIHFVLQQNIAQYCKANIVKPIKMHQETVRVD